MINSPNSESMVFVLFPKYVVGNKILIVDVCIKYKYELLFHITRIFEIDVIMVITNNKE